MAATPTRTPTTGLTRHWWACLSGRSPKVIISGSRNYYNYHGVVNAVITSKFEITEVVSGGARGVDKLGERFAEEYGYPLRVFPADWDTHGKAAGPLRNREMAEYADALIAVWDGVSPGTKNMIQQAKAKGLKILIYKV